VAARCGAVTRLSRATLDMARRDEAVSLPRALGSGRRTGLLHLGVGAFHRAHQAVVTEDAMACAGEDRWGICGVTQRSATVVGQLRPQDNLYAVLQRGQDGDTLRVVGSLSEVLFAGDEPRRLEDRFVDPDVEVVTMTVTEKGYRRSGSGGLDLHDPLVVADVAGGMPRTAVGQLVRGLQARSRTSAAPITVLSCDNVVHNGAVVQRLVHDFCAALPDAEAEPLGDWVRSSVRFPSSMVDRIVPATTDADRDDARHLLGLEDRGLVVAEPFLQWVVEDDFAAGRPRWEAAGAQLTGDVTPYEEMKLRVLNGAHSMLAYLGALAGHETIAAAVRDEKLAEAAYRLIHDDVLPTLAGPDGTDLEAYGRQVLDRFANPALRHRTVQVAMDGSQKIPLRLLGTVRDRIAAGETPLSACRAVAAWMVYVTAGRDRLGRPLPLDDPLAPTLRDAVAGRAGADTVVDALLGVREVFDDGLRASTPFRDALVPQVAELLALVDGAAAGR
jgi:fructuronate reductase